MMRCTRMLAPLGRRHARGMADIIKGMDETLFKVLIEEVPAFNKALGVKVAKVSSGYLALDLAYKPEFLGNPLVPALHGGVCASLLDHAAGFCAWTVLPDDSYGMSTIDLRIDYVRPAPCEDLFAEATVTHKGSRLIWADATVKTKASGETVALARGTFNVYKLPTKQPMSEVLRGYLAQRNDTKASS